MMIGKEAVQAPSMQTATMCLGPLSSIDSQTKSAMYWASFVWVDVSFAFRKTVPAGVESKQLMMGRREIEVQPSDISNAPVSSINPSIFLLTLV